MDLLLVSLMPPRSSMSLLGAGTSSSMLRGDSETECLREELADGASDFDERDVLPLTMFMTLFMVSLHTITNKHTGGFSPVEEHTKNTRRTGGKDQNMC